MDYQTCMSLNKKLISVTINLSNERRQHGWIRAFFYVLTRTKTYLLASIKFILTLPIAAIIIAIRPLIEINLVMLLSSRIGHFSANTEFMLLSQYKEIYAKKKCYLFYEETLVCNKQLSIMWKRVLTVLPFPRICLAVDKTLAKLLGKKYTGNPVKAFESCLLGRDHQQLLEKRDVPYIYFTPREIMLAEKKMQAFGTSITKPFVCLLIRDAGYLNHRAPGKNLYKHHDCRNADINNYRKAALYLAEKGYTVFRMGKHVEKKFEINHPNIIDYANHPLQCDLMDIYLAAHCQFIISTSTGLDCITQLFRKPLLFTDLLPIYRQLQFWYPCKMFIPKKIRYRDTQELFSFSALENAFTGVSDVQLQHALDENNAEVIPNTEDEICDAVIEMVARVNHTWVETEENKQRQKLFLETVFPSTIFYDEFYHQFDKIKVTIGSQFLQDNLALCKRKTNPSPQPSPL